MNKKTAIIIILSLVLFLFAACTVKPDDSSSNEKTNETQCPVLSKKGEEILQQQDEKLLSEYQLCSLNENFSDNSLSIIFKHSFVGDVSTAYFNHIETETEVVSVVDTTGTAAEVPNISVEIKLATNDKSIVLALATELMAWDDILIAEPIRFYIRYHYSPTDPM